MGEFPCAWPAAPGAQEAVRDPIVAEQAALDEVKAYLRLEGTAEDEELGRLIAAAIGHGEAFTGRMFLIRTVRETVPADAAWRRLVAAPVRAITAVGGIDASGASVVLDEGQWAIDIDASGDGWVRVAGGSAVRRAQATCQAGIASGWTGLPEPLRQGAVRLATHLFTARDDPGEGAPPAAVAALWRPWRRMRLL